MVEKIQTRVLREIWKSNGKYNVPQMAKNLDLKEHQVYSALHHLENRQLIIIDRERIGGKYRDPPRNKLKISPNLKRKKKIKKVIGI